MKRGNPNFVEGNKIGEKTQFKRLSDVKEKLHSKVFGVRLPESAAEKLLKLPTKERTLIMRQALLDVIAELN
jgi:hypothetical protein